MELPFELRAAIEKELESQSSNRLSGLASEISQSYRTRKPLNKGKYLRSSEDVIAYSAFRLPATYAAVYSAIGQIVERFPQIKPKTLLDAGAGPGTAMWAASAFFKDLEHITLLEQEGYMIDIGKRLAEHSALEAVKTAEWIKYDITKAWKVPPHDMVIASYVMNELPQDKRIEFIQRLWESTAGLLLIIEPGTPEGFMGIKKAREQLMAEGAKTIAPCPHNRPCPLGDDDWCHFSQRVARTRIHRRVKGGELSFEDEKFSFLCVSRIGVSEISGLVLRHPQVKKGFIELKLCTPDGLKSTVVTKRDKEQFKKARDLHWGSIIP